MSNKLIFSGIIVFCLGFLSCAHKQVVVSPPPLTCSDLLQSSFSMAGDEEIKTILDEAKDKDQMECWVPLVKKCLDKKRDIPHRHVTYAVKTFNKKKDELYFHKAVLRYFLDMIRAGTKIKYRPDIDRPFLKAYCHYAITRATTQQDPILLQAKDICRRLDPYLYEHFFGRKYQ